jgi:hypothetical protein
MDAEELRLALASHLPCLIVHDRSVSLNEAVRAAAGVVDVVEYSADPDWTPRLDAALELLNRHYRPPADPADVLYLTSWSGGVETVRSLVFRIAGMHLTTLALWPEGRVPMEAIRYADVVLCELNLADARGWMIAGCAMALERKLVLLMAEGQGDSGTWFGVPVHRYVSELDRLAIASHSPPPPAESDELGLQSFRRERTLTRGRPQAQKLLRHHAVRREAGTRR